MKGFLLATYEDIVALLGPSAPATEDEPACWTLRFDDGTIVALYCYKCAEIPRHFYTWHIGGDSRKAVTLLAEALGSELLDCPDMLELFAEYRRLGLSRKQNVTYAWADPDAADS